MIRNLFLLSSIVIVVGCKSTQVVPEQQYFQLSMIDTPEINGAVIEGTIMELELGEPVIFGTIVLYREGKFLTAGETDFDGNYQLEIQGIEEELHLTVECQYLGLKTVRLEDVVVKKGMVTKLNIQMVNGDITLPIGPICPYYSVPLIEVDNMTSGQTFTSDQISCCCQTKRY